MGNSKYLEDAGTFECCVDDKGHGVFFTESSKGTPCIELPLVVISEGFNKGKYITYRGYLSEAAFDYTIAALVKAFPSWDGDIQMLARKKFTFDTLCCQIVTSLEDYNGKTQCRINWINPPNSTGGGKVATPLATSKLDELIKKMGGRAKAIAKAEKTGTPTDFPRNPKPAPVSDSTPPIDEDDDVPF